MKTLKGLRGGQHLSTYRGRARGFCRLWSGRDYCVRQAVDTEE